MKKIISLLLAVVMLATLCCACGGDKSADKVKVIDIALSEESYAFCVGKDDAELLTKVNEYLTKIKGDGTFDAICNKYFGDGKPSGVTSAAEDASKDQLVVATNAAFAPFEYKEGDTYYGVDMEIMAALAESLGRELVISNMDFDAVCLSVGQSKADIAMAGLTVNEKRKEYVNFTVSYYNAAQMLVVNEKVTAFDNCKTAEEVLAVLAKEVK